MINIMQGLAYLNGIRVSILVEEDLSTREAPSPSKDEVD